MRHLELVFRAAQEHAPGPVWAAHYARVAAANERWFLSDGDGARPSYLACESALRRHMPEMVPLWERLVVLAGGGDRAARMLSLYCPPLYLAGCSQVLWNRGVPGLLRNYDYVPERCEGMVLRSEWGGMPVIALVDSMWGVLDGMNARGLAVSLAFGGRSIVGKGFGIPLILRYVLQTCWDTAQAVAVLQRMPSHMCYSVGVIDAHGVAATVFLNPDRPARVVGDVLSTNHQRQVEWPAYAAATGTVGRLATLERLLGVAHQTAEGMIAGLTRPPLYIRDAARRTATLYTAAYRPSLGELSLIWPSAAWRLSFDRFVSQEIRIRL